MPPTWDTRLRRAAAESWRWRKELLAAGALLPVMSFRLRRHGYAKTRVWLDERADQRRHSPGGEHKGPVSTVSTARELGFIVRLASRLLPDATCLRKALVLRYLLTGRSIPSVIRFGVRRDPDSVALAFHAWVEVSSQVVSELPQLVTGYEILLEEPPTDATL